MAKLNIFVHVVERHDDGTLGRQGVFGPDDELPDWALEMITNPDVWAEPPIVESSTMDRPRANMSRDTWAAYAATRGVAVTNQMSRDEIIAAVAAQG